MKGGDPLAGAWLRLFGGTALAYVDPMRAERELRGFLKVGAGQPKLRTVMGDAYYNLGYVYRALAEADREIGAFTEAICRYREVGREDRAWICAYEITWGYLLHGSPEKAQPHLWSLLERIDEYRDPELEADVGIAEALYHRQVGALQRSDQTCREVRERFDLLPRQVGDLFWILGCNALDQGDLLSAARLGSEAYDAAFPVWWPPQLRRIADLNMAVADKEKVGR